MSTSPGTELLSKAKPLIYSSEEYSSNKLDQAKTHLDEALKLEPKNVFFLYHKAFTFYCMNYLRSNEYYLREALKIVDDIIEMDMSFTASFFLKVLLLYSKSSAEGVKYFESVKDMDANNEESCYSKALCIDRMSNDTQKKDQALELLNKVNINVIFKGFKETMYILRDKKDYTQGVLKADIFIKANPSEILGYKFKISMHEYLKQYDLAIEPVDKWIQLLPKGAKFYNDSPYSIKQTLLINLEKYEDALETANKRLKDTPFDIKAWFDKFDVLSKHIKIKKSEKYLEYCKETLFCIPLEEILSISRPRFSFVSFFYDPLFKQFDDVFDYFFQLLCEENNQKDQKTPLFNGIMVLETTPADIISIFEILINKGAMDHYSKYLADALMIKACILYASKKYPEAKVCLEHEKLILLKNSYFKDYCLGRVYLAQNMRKEAWIICEQMMNYCYFEDKNSWHNKVPNSHRFVYRHGATLREEILNESLLKEISQSKRKELKKEAQELLDKAFSLTFNGLEETDYLKAIEFLNEAVNIEPESSILMFYQCLFDCLIKNKWENEVMYKLNEIIKKDFGFLPAYYLKKFIYSEKESNKSYNKMNRKLKPTSQHDYFIKVLISLQLNKKIKKHTFEYLEKCNEKAFTKKILDLKRIYYERKEMKAEELATANEYIQKYPKENVENVFKALVEMDKIEEAIIWAPRLKKQKSEKLEIVFPKFLEKIEAQCFTENGFVMKFNDKTLIDICEFITTYDPEQKTIVSRGLNFKGCIQLFIHKNYQEAFQNFETSINIPQSSWGSGWTSTQLYSSKYSYTKSCFYNANYCKAATLLNKTEIARISCEKAYGYLCHFGYSDGLIEKYYKCILFEEVPKLFTADFLKKMKERKPEIINEQAKPDYLKGLQILTTIPATDATRKLALASFDKALNFGKSDLISFQRAKCLDNNDEIDAIIEKDPLFVAAYYVKAMRLPENHNIRAGNYYDLIKNFEPNDQDEESNFAKGDYLFEGLKKYEEALPYLKNISLNYLKSYFNQGKFFADTKQNDKAKDIYDLLIKNYPLVEESYIRKSFLLEFQLLVELLHIWAKTFPKSKNLSARLEKFCEVKENPAEEKLAIANIYYEYFKTESKPLSLGIQYIEFLAYDENGFNLSKCKKSSEDLMKFCQEKHHSYKGLVENIKGSIYLTLNKPEEALKCFEECVKSFESYALYHCNKGVALTLLNRPKNALPAFEKAYSALQMNKVAYLGTESPSAKSYVKATIEKERMKIINSLIDDINKHSVVLDEVKVLEAKVVKLQRQITLNHLDGNDPVMQDLKLVTEKIKESDKAVEKLVLEKEKLMKIAQDTSKQTGILELTAQVESFKGKADKAKEEKDKLEIQYQNLEAKVALLFKNYEKVNSQVVQISSDVKTNVEKVEKIEIVQKEESKKIEEHENVLREGGVYAKVELKNNLLKLESGFPEQFAYAKTFYWTMLNYFGAYRNLSSNLFEKNVNEGQETNNLFVEGIKKVAEVGKEIAKGVPFVGNVIGSLDSVIDLIYGTYKEKKFEFKIRVINLMIQKKFTIEEDISLEIGKLAIEMSNIRNDEITKDVKESKSAKVWNWLNKKMDNLNKMVFPYLEINSERGAQIALKDIVALFAYIFKNHEIILSRSDSMAKQFENIIVFGSLDNLIKESQEENRQNENEVASASIVNTPMKKTNEVPMKKIKKSRKCTLI